MHSPYLELDSLLLIKSCVGLNITFKLREQSIILPHFSAVWMFVDSSVEV